MLTEVVIEDPRWAAMDLATMSETAAAATLAHLSFTPSDWELSVLGCDDARIAALNTDFRGKDAATNVLSWPTNDLSAETPGGRPDLPDATEDPYLGDIAIAYDTCQREAQADGKPMTDHCTHLLVHGLLHLLGYDHIRDPDATLMERIEVEILGKLGISDPY